MGEVGDGESPNGDKAATDPGPGQLPPGETSVGEVIETRTGKVWLDELGILHGWARPGAEMTAADAAEIHEARIRLAGEEPVRSIVDMTHVRSMDRDARNEMRKEKYTGGTTALALLVRSRVSRMIGNFFITVSRPEVPIKMFTDKAEAIAWLFTFDG